MTSFYSLKQSKDYIPIICVGSICYFTQKLLVFTFLLAFIFQIEAQTAPNISYSQTHIYAINTSIPSLEVTNSGGAVPLGNYGKTTVFAGSGAQNNTNNSNPLLATFYAPMGMVQDENGHIYFSDQGNHRIKKIDAITGAVTQIAGAASNDLFPNGFNDGTGIGNARFSFPAGMDYDGNGALYVADWGNNKIRKIIIATGAVSTVAGGGTGKLSGYVDALGSAARFNTPTDVKFRVQQSNGIPFLYVTDAGNNCIRTINLNGSGVSTFAGVNTAGSTEGNLTTARFNNPTSMAFSSTGILFIVDRGNNKVRKIEGSTVSTFAGSGTNATTNGTGTAAEFADPYGIALDGDGNLYVTQALSGIWPSANPGFSVNGSTINHIRKVTPTGEVSIFAGRGIHGSVDHVDKLLATYAAPAHLLFDSSQNSMYVSEWLGHKIRKIELLGYEVVPSLPLGLTLNATGNITGTPTAVNNGPVNYTITAYNIHGNSAATVSINTGNTPVVHTNNISAVTASTAAAGGAFSSLGTGALLERGVCWGTTANPTILDNKVIDASAGATSYSSAITGLASFTTYYLRAYATNVFGTSYGEQRIFTTLLAAPAISYTTPTAFVIDTAITPLQLINTGGQVPAIIIKSPVISTIAGTGSTGSNNGLGTQATFNTPLGVAVTSGGQYIYVADANNHSIRRIDKSGGVITFAGSGSAGDVMGTGTGAAFNYPMGVAVDATGNVYVTDFYNKKIKKITPAGLVSTLAGSGENGIIDGIGNEAAFNSPRGIAIDQAGNLYVTDYCQIRKITPSGVVSTLAGTMTVGSTDGTGAEASFYYPWSLAVDGQGSVYVADTWNHKIRKITPTGTVSTFAGSGNQGLVNGTGIQASFTSPQGLVLDAAGNVYVSENAISEIRKITAAGVVTSLSFTDGSPTRVSGLALDALGYIYFTEQNNHRIKKIALAGYSVSPDLPQGLVLNNDGSISGTPIFSSPATDYEITATNYVGSSSTTLRFAVKEAQEALKAPVISYTTPGEFVVNTAITPLQTSNAGGQIPSVIRKSPMVTTIAGTGNAGSNNGTGAVATFNSPTGVAVTSDGQFAYVADSYNHSIRKIDQSSGLVTTLAGSRVSGDVLGTGTAASFSYPNGVAVDAAGNVYVTDFSNRKIKKITPTGLVSTLAGSGANTQIDGTGLAASFISPRGIATDRAGNLYVTDAASIRKITPLGVVSTLAGSGTGFDDATGNSARFNNPRSLAVDREGIVYVADSGNRRIRKITQNGVVSTFAGNGNTAVVNGTGTEASFDNPVGLAVDDSGNVYVSEQTAWQIRKITAAGVVTSLSFTDGSFFQYPGRLAADAAGDIYFAAEYNHIISKISLTGYSVSPALPQGLVLNNDGSITGTPIFSSPATDYVITGTNSAGSSSTTLRFAVSGTGILTWTGTQWINGSVSPATPAIIEGNYTSTGNIAVGELTVKNNAVVLFKSGHNLTVNGKLTVETGSTFTLESNANLVQTTNVQNSGVISIKRNTAPLKHLDYVLWSSPVTGQQLQSFSPITLSNRFYTYNADTNVYNALTTTATDVFASGKGYLIRMPNNHPITPTIWNGTFTGTPNNGTVDVSIAIGSYNALGNPYPSAIRADDFIDVNQINGALYFWRKTNNSANPSYATYTKAGGVGTANSADPNGLIPNGIIQVGQGFITAVNYMSATFTNAMRIANNENQFLRTKKEDKNRIWLNLANASGFFSQAMVAYMDGATSGIDAAIDGRYFNDSKTALTSIINNEEFTIQGRSLPFDASDVVALGFKTETAGNYTLAIDHTDGLFATGQKVFLKDNVTNTINDISTGSYTFTSFAGVFNTRFELVYQKTLGTNDAKLLANQVVISNHNDKIRIDAGTQIIVGVKVYDLNGRLLMERKNINASNALLNINSASQVLMVHVITSEGSVSVKKILKK